MKVIRLLRAFKLKNLFLKIEEYIQLSSGIAAIISILKLSILIIIVCHWCACIWHFIAIAETSYYETTWLRDHDIINENWKSKFIFI